MNKLICIAAMLCIATVITAQPAIVYLNSETVTCTNTGKTKECLQYKYKQTDTAWSIYKGGTIRGFTYNPGYFYRLQIRQLPVNRQQWNLLKVISKTKSTVQQQPADSKTGTDTTIKPPSALIGQWKFSKLIVAGKETELGANNETLQFDPVILKITGRASCNRFFGNYTTGNEGQIKFEAIGSTRMACEAIDTETSMLKAMEMVTAWRITNSTLYLKTGNTTIIELRRAPSISPNGGGNQ